MELIESMAHTDHQIIIETKSLRIRTVGAGKLPKRKLHFDGFALSKMGFKVV